MMAGIMTDSLVKPLFVGELDAGRLLPYPFLGGDRTELLDMVRESLGRFARDRIDAAAIDREHHLPAEILDGLAELGLFGLRIPEEHGGLGLDATQYAWVGVDLARHDGATAIMSGGHSTIGIKALLLHGSDEQKARYLPRLATGELKAAFALSEPDAGSDAQSLKLTARRSADGRSYVLDGTKLWITNGGFADLVTVFARTPDHPRSDGRPSISCFLVERAMGFQPGREEDKLGIRGSSTVPLVFEGVRVPAGNLVGEPGDGFRIALQVLNTGRTGLASNCLGNCRFLLEQTVAYTGQREQFGRPIADFELVQQKLARMAWLTHALESMVFLTTGLMDRGVQDLALEAALCKVFGTEALWTVVNDAVQCAGGNGFTTDYPFERLLRDARVNMIFEGTNEILRLMVAGQGLAGPAGLLAGGDVPVQSRYGRRVAGMETADPLPVPPALRSEALALSLGVAELAQGAAAVCRRTGGDLRRRHELVAALSDLALSLYGQMAVLARATTRLEQQGEEAAADELVLARGAARYLAGEGRAAAARLRDAEAEAAAIAQTAAAVRRLGGPLGEHP